MLFGWLALPWVKGEVEVERGKGVQGKKGEGEKREKLIEKMK